MFFTHTFENHTESFRPRHLQCGNVRHKSQGEDQPGQAANVGDYNGKEIVSPETHGPDLCPEMGYIM